MRSIATVILLAVCILSSKKSFGYAAYEVHCSTENGRIFQLLFRKTPYHIRSVNNDTIRIIHINDIDKLTPESDYLIESIGKNKQTYKLSCKRIE